MATPDGPGGRWLSVRSSGTALPGTGAPAAGDRTGRRRRSDPLV